MNGIGFAPLGYATTNTDPQRRSGGVTAVAVVGIVLCCLVLVGQSLMPRGISGRPSGSWGAALSSGMAVGMIIRTAIIVLMIAGAVGVLAMRNAGRRMMIIASWAWIILFVLELFIVVYLFATSARGTLRYPDMLISTVVSFVAGGLFPAFALIVLDNARTATLYRAQRYEDGPPGTLARVAASILLAYGAISSISSVTSLAEVVEKMPARNSYSYREYEEWDMPSRLPGFPASREASIVGGMIDVALDVLVIFGALLIVCNIGRGAKYIIIFAMVSLTLSVLWQFQINRGREWQFTTSAPTTLRETLAHYSAIISRSITELLPSALILVIFGFMRPRSSLPPIEPNSHPLPDSDLRKLSELDEMIESSLAKGPPCPE